MSRSRRERGVAMTEAAICLSAFALLIQGALYFGEAYVQREGTIAATRYIAFRALRSNDSTIKPSQHKKLLRQNYPLTGKTAYTTAKTRYTFGATSATAGIARAAKRPVTATTLALAGSMAAAAGDRMVRHTVTATLAPVYLTSLKTLKLEASLTVPNGVQYTRDDLNGEDLIDLGELELGNYVRKTMD